MKLIIFIKPSKQRALELESTVVPRVGERIIINTEKETIALDVVEIRHQILAHDNSKPTQSCVQVFTTLVLSTPN